ncbi:MAG: DUF86 domain-containing protein [Thermodesulfovibrio sp.]|nr:DUF86 domain-containing protein [Thermodesulfovibrio sp.]
MRESIRVKTEKIEEYLKIITNMEKDCEEKFSSDPIYRGALLHYLYLTADSCISLAEMIIKEKNFRTPQTYSEAIEILGENGVIPSDFAYDFAKIGGLRKILANDYERVDMKIICKEVLKKLPDIKKYLSYIRDFMNF